MSSSAAVHPPHVVLVPLPAQGHINPFTSLAHFLAASGINVTIVHSTRTHSLLSSYSAAAAPATADGTGTRPQGSIRTAVMPDIVSSASDSSKPARLSLDNFKASIPIMCKGLEEILEKLMQEDGPPCCLIADKLLPWCHGVALKFGLPRIEVWTGPASVLALGMHIPEMLARGYIPVIDEESHKKMIDFIPGLPPFCAADLPRNMKAVSGLQTPGFQLVRSAFEHSESVDRILVNSVYELESNVAEALKIEGAARADFIGPLFMMSSITSAGRSASSLLQEDSACLTWLDKQTESSVLYISFGSIAELEADVFEELAHGVEASGENFLWVIRPDIDKDKAQTPEDRLPKGFMERTKDRGLVISWAPQLAVLQHPSVGAFLTHCGWNSILESLSSGIPTLGFPQEAEQSMNCKLTVDVWGVGLPLLEAGAHKIERMHVRRAVEAIMKGGEGRQVRKRVREWSDAALKASKSSSKINLQKLVDDLKNGHLKAPH